MKFILALSLLVTTSAFAQMEFFKQGLAKGKTPFMSISELYESGEPMTLKEALAPCFENGKAVESGYREIEARIYPERDYFSQNTRTVECLLERDNMMFFFDMPLWAFGDDGRTQRAQSRANFPARLSVKTYMGSNGEEETVSANASSDRDCGEALSKRSFRKLKDGNVVIKHTLACSNSPEESSDVSYGYRFKY
jgi:hypothetical protein